MDSQAALNTAKDSLKGLAVGDAFGEQWSALSSGRDTSLEGPLRNRKTPPAAAWPWTDDTAMALSVGQILERHGEVRPTELARAFGESFAADDGRGYGLGMHELLPRLKTDPDGWARYVTDLFDGQGSLGNGAAMRIAPLGAYFYDDVDRAVEQAALAARVTHAHPEGVAGAVAVAVAASLCARKDQQPLPADAFIRQVMAHTPQGAVHDGLGQAAALPASTTSTEAARVLGNGSRVRADDTVPYAVWCAAQNSDDLTQALWETAQGLGDVDTTCAIAGGIVAARTGVERVSSEWLRRSEPLPDWVNT
ncbi:ADP-ribosylglycohydrolase family protein [Streptomyces monticola]|uniref:ADP-ribosylglycohydrolase family protein n=1 Tax=Streptomyces monticola TaxID=2666263 RepID=A0ABW2JR88_9ACTN